MDKLQKCAKAFERLLDKKYRIIIGRKGKSVEIEIGFNAVDFHHLAGLHKLRDLRISRNNREKVFSDILSGNILLPKIQGSKEFYRIENRLDPLAELESLIDSNRLIFRYNKKINSFSLITAQYLLSTPFQTTDAYIFLDRKEDCGQFFCRSFFLKGDRDYTIGQAIYTLLYKEKITISTGIKEIQYDRISSPPRDCRH